jgi:carboxyl-terminal processing protease
MTQEAMAYLNEALDYIQANSVMRARIDWSRLRQESFELAAQAQIPTETYPVIERALELLGDHHSHFRDPQSVQRLDKGQTKQFGLRVVWPEGIVGIVSPGSPAEHAGVQVGDQIETLNGQPMTHLSLWQLRKLLILSNMHHDLTLTMKPVGKSLIRSVHLQAASYSTASKPQGKLLEHAIGYLDLPGLAGSPQQASAYAQTVQQLIREIDQIAPCSKWVIDLRRNTGGNMWPMIAGVGPILGEGEWVVFVEHLEKEAAFYRAGQAGIVPDHVLAAVDEPYELKCHEPSVAVLTSQLTSSSGEFTALAFRGLPHTCSFGEATQGVPTANGSKKLSDGALIILTAALGSDRTGQTYDGPLLPDYPAKIDWTQMGTAEDPVLQAAIQWLLAGESC